jgi:hypothetical protein
MACSTGYSLYSPVFTVRFERRFELVENRSREIDSFPRVLGGRISTGSMLLELSGLHRTGLLPRPAAPKPVGNAE